MPGAGWCATAFRRQCSAGDGRGTERVIQPFAVAYYTGGTLICAWCELRNDVRHFRTDRLVSADMLDESFSIPATVIAQWLAERQDD
jgi:predicted DNA-binding transcriptional regulator YafY